MYASAVTKVLTAGSANVIAHSQSLGGAGTLTLTAAPVVLDTQRRVILTSAGDDSGIAWTVTGTNEGGAPIKDQFAGGDEAAAQSNLDFLTVTSIYGSGATASTVTAGTNSVGSSPWKMFGDTLTPPQASIYMELLSGSGEASFEYTYDSFLPPSGVQPAIAYAGPSPNPSALALTDMTNVTASTEGTLETTIHAWRLTIVSGTGIWKCTTRQAGLASP